jgi:hypothetical protein
VYVKAYLHFLRHLPTHSSREIGIIFGALTTCDPDNIHETIDACVKDKIRVSVVALAAEMKVCKDVCERTGGGLFKKRRTLFFFIRLTMGFLQEACLGLP